MMLRGTRGTVFVALFVLASLTGGTSSHSHGYIYLQARSFKIAHKGSAGAVAEPTACKEHTDLTLFKCLRSLKLRKVAN